MVLKSFINDILPNSYDDNMFKLDGNLNPSYKSFKKTGIIANIFEDHWFEVYSNNKSLIDYFRPNANKEIKKIIESSFNCQHRQIVFTIPVELRKYFFNLKKINILFEAVKQTIYSLANDFF